ncbi:MAG: hypothetical protein K2K29_06475 [Muribaculaceae bacterium]|nr:hypothetical protein [Muribaculaceae bacterium]
MIQNENNTPIWLDIKKEYIDDNLDRLLGYIHNNRAAAHDPFYSVTLRLIRERVKDVLEAVAERPIYLEEIPQENLIFNIRLLACYLLTFPDAHDRIKVLLALLQNVAVYVPKYADDIITLAGNCLKYDKLEKVGCSFNDIIHFRKEIFTYKLCKETRFSEKISVAKKLDGYGRIWQTDEGITITSPGNRSLEERLAALAYSLDTGIGSRLGSFRGEQLKTSDASVFAKMVDFISGFLKSQEQPLRQPQSIKKFSYAPGDSLVVRVTEVRPNFQEPGKFDILVETTDPDYTYLKGKYVFSVPYKGCLI